MLWDRVGLSVVGWGGGKRWDMSKPISIIINHKFTRPSAISTLEDFSLSQNRQPILHNLIFIPLTKVASAHRSINYFQFFGVI